MSAGVAFHVVRDAELKAIRKRRSHHDSDSEQQNHLEKNLVGLALSGGGVRSASFGLGIVQALDERGLFRDVDYLSTVSGGGYLGGYISALALDSATHRESELGDENSQRTDDEEGGASQGPDGTNALPRHSITPIVSPSNEPQNRRVRRLVYSGDYLRSALAFLNRYVFGLILINIFAFSGILTVAAGLAWLFRLLDDVRVSSALKIFGFKNDMTRAFFPAFVCAVLWVVCWALSYWSTAAAKASKYLLGLLFACVLIAFAALLGTGDIGIADLPRIFSLSPTSGDVNAIADVLRIVIIAPLIVFLVPYLNPRRFLQSGLSPTSVWERLTFKIVSFALLIGIPLLAFGYLARENVSGVNDRRDGTFRSSSEVRNWNDGDAPFWQRVEGESDEAKKLLDLINNKTLVGVAGIEPDDVPKERPFDALFQIDYNLPVDLAADDQEMKRKESVNRKQKEKLVRLFRKRMAVVSGTEFLSHAIWTERGTLADARRRHPELPIPRTSEEMVSFLARIGGASESSAGSSQRWTRAAIRADLEGAQDRIALAALGIAGSAAAPPLLPSLPSNELLRHVLVKRINSFNTLNGQANSRWYSPYLLALESTVSQFNTVESEPEEIVRLHRLQMEIEALRCMMLENLNAALRNTHLEAQLPSDEDVQSNTRLQLLPTSQKTRIFELRRRTKSLQDRDATPGLRREVTQASRNLLEVVYPNGLADEREIFRWGVLREDQKFRAHFLFGAALVFLIAGFVVNLKTTSPHGYYRQQLHATWLSDQQAFRGDVRLAQVNTTSEGYPYHLIVATANYLRATHDEEHRGATDLFLLSRLFCGSDRTGYQPTNDYAGGTYDLASAIAVSAGALSPSQIKNLFVSMMAMLLNLRLGEWLPNPGYHPKRLRGLRQRLQRWPAPFFVAPSVLRAGPLERRAFCFVTDGGHYENLGVAPLLKRRCRLIICVDAGHDPDYRFQDFAALERRMRVDEGIVFSAVDSDNLPDEGGVPVDLNAVVPRRLLQRKTAPPGDESPAENKGAAPESKRRSVDDLQSEAHFAVFKIWYPPDEQSGAPRIGYCIYIKPAFTGDEDLDLISFASQNREFPHDSTADQFYEPDKFESYRQLGYHTGIAVSAKAIGPGSANGRLGNWRPPTGTAGEVESPAKGRKETGEPPRSERINHALAGLADRETPAERVLEHSELLVDCLQRGELDAGQRNAFRRHVNSQSRRFLRAGQWESLEPLINVLKALGRGARPALLELFAAKPAPPELRRLAGGLLTQIGLARSAQARRAVELVAKDEGAPDDLRTTASELLSQLAPDASAST
jgi:Patatin-like phospholipase